MTQEKWEEILGTIKDNFKYKNESREHLDEEGGVDVHSIEFNGPLGRMRLEYIIKPVVLDKKTTYSKRIGSETKVDYVYSPDEKTNKLMVYKWDDGQDSWVEIDSKNFNI